MWIDDTRCDLRFHDIIRRDGKWIVLHGDGEVCEEVEFGRSGNEDSDEND